MVWIVFIHLEEKTVLKLQKKVFENKDISNVVMLSEETNVFELN